MGQIVLWDAFGIFGASQTSIWPSLFCQCFRRILENWNVFNLRYKLQNRTDIPAYKLSSRETNTQSYAKSRISPVPLHIAASDVSRIKKLFIIVLNYFIYGADILRLKNLLSYLNVLNFKLLPKPHLRKDFMVCFGGMS